MKRFSKIVASVFIAALLAVPAFAAKDAKKANEKTVTTASRRAAGENSENYQSARCRDTMIFCIRLNII